MAIIALRQIVSVAPLTGTDPDYGDPTYGEPYEAKCRFDERMKLVRNQRGEEVVSSGRFFFDHLAGVNFGDKLTYTNELGVVTTYDPLSIGVIRDAVGKPVLTEVSV